MKVTVLLNKLLKWWFEEISFGESNFFIFPHCNTVILRLSKYYIHIHERNPISRKNKGSKSDFPKLFFNVIVAVCINTSKIQMSQSFFKTSSSFMRCKCHFALESEPLSETETTSAMSVYQIFRNISPMIYHNLSRFKLRLQNLVAKCFGLAEF